MANKVGKQNGIAPLLIVTIAAAILVAGVGGYFVVSKNKVLSSSLNPEQSPLQEKKEESALVMVVSKKSPVEKLQGIWIVEGFFEFNFAAKQFKPSSQGDKNSYVEFKGGKICADGKLDGKGKLLPCSRYENFKLDGAQITVGGTSQKLPPLEWAIINDKLEFIFEVGDQKGLSKRFKVVFKHSTARSDSSKKRAEPLREQTPMLEVNQSKLTGLWQLERAFVVSPSGEFKEAPVPFPLYTEFKNSTICRKWELAQTISSCKEYERIRIAGSIMEILDQSGKASTIFQWGLANGKLELIQIVDGKPKSKTISIRVAKVEFKLPAAQAPTPKEISLNQEALLGSWKIDKILGFDPATDEWKVGTGTGVTYQEFTGKYLCLGYQTLTGANPEVYKCSKYVPYTVTKDVIAYEAYDIFSKQNTTAYYKWNIVDGKLELSIGISDKPFLKYVYNKIPLPTNPAEPFILTADKTSEKIGYFGASFNISSAIKTTDTIHLWVTDENGVKVIINPSLFDCEKGKVCISTGGLSLEPDPVNPQCPFQPTITTDKFGREKKLSEVLCFVPWGYSLDGKVGPRFSLQVIINAAGSYTIHAKLISSGLEATLPITAAN